MDTPKIIEELTKYLNELLGYFLPGLMLSLSIYFFIDIKKITTYSEPLIQSILIIITISYVLGYIVYGAALARNKILSFLYRYLSKIKDIKLLEERVAETLESKTEFKSVKSIILNNFPQIKEEDIKLRFARSLAMSYCPEADQKIYTFMFRAELCNHIGFLCLFWGLWSFIAYYASKWYGHPLLIRNDQLENLYIPILLILFAYFLHLARYRFLDIAYKLPLSIYLSKKPIK